MINIWNQKQLLEKLVGHPPLLCECGQCEPGEIYECIECKWLMPWCEVIDGYTCEICWNKANDTPTEMGGAA